MTPARRLSPVWFALAFAAMGSVIVGAPLLAVVRENPPRVGALAVSTLLFCAAVGWLSSQMELITIGVVLLSICGGMVNGGVCALVAGSPDMTSGGMLVGVLASFIFMSPLVLLALRLWRIGTARSGSIVHRVHGRMLVSAFAVVGGLVTAIAGPPVAAHCAVGVTSVVLVVVFGFNLRSLLRTRRLAGSTRGLCETPSPSGGRESRFVDIGVGEQSWERGDDRALLRGAPWITTVFMGDAKLAVRQLAGLLVVDGLGMAVALTMLVTGGQC